MTVRLHNTSMLRIEKFVAAELARGQKWQKSYVITSAVDEWLKKRGF